MAAQYQAIRDALMKREGLPAATKPKNKAAREFISRGVNKSQGSMMARLLLHSNRGAK